MRPFIPPFFLKNMTLDNVFGNTGYSYGAYQFNNRAIENNVTEVGYIILILYPLYPIKILRKIILIVVE